MRKTNINWQMRSGILFAAFGIVFIVGGISSIEEGISSFVFSVLFGALFIFFGILMINNGKKSSHKTLIKQIAKDIQEQGQEKIIKRSVNFAIHIYNRLPGKVMLNYIQGLNPEAVLQISMKLQTKKRNDGKISENTKGIYEDIVIIYTDDFKMAFPHCEENVYLGFEKKIMEIITNGINRKELLDNIIKNVKNYTEDITRLDVNKMKEKILEDKNLKEIHNISLDIYKLACKKLHNEDYGREVLNREETISKLQMLLKGVFGCNIEEARWLIAEAVVDLSYLCGNNTVMSLRLAEESKKIMFV